MLSAGIDIGSTTTKVVIIDDKKKIQGFSVVPTGADMKAAEKLAMSKALIFSNTDIGSLDTLIASGYGRERSQYTQTTITEIKAMALGADVLFPGVKTLIDIGGQDNKAIKINSGKINEFRMNDKCAAGTGRFLELISQVLNISLDDMSDAAKKIKKYPTLSKTCAVFAQSEVITLLSKGASAAEIIQGSYEAISKRVLAMAASLRVEKPLVLSGGVAKSASLVKMFTKVSGEKVQVPHEPQILGCLGSAVFGLSKI